MTPEKRIYESIKNMLIKKEGYNFLKLSEKDQDNLIADEFRKHIEKIKERPLLTSGLFIFSINPSIIGFYPYTIYDRPLYRVYYFGIHFYPFQQFKHVFNTFNFFNFSTVN